MDSTVETKVDSMDEHEFKKDTKKIDEKYFNVVLIIENNV